MNKPKIMLTVDVEALTKRAEANHVNTLIYGRKDGKEYGIGRMMDIADKHNIKMTFFVDFAECEWYGDEILEVGRYIESRGHDLQVHCHYDCLEKVVGKKSWESNKENFYHWYVNEDDSRKMIDYVTKKYVECTGKIPTAYRGGSYRFGASILKVLKDSGYIADLTYNPDAEFDYFTTTLSISPLKNAKKLNEIGEMLSKEWDAAYLYSDFKKKEGYKKSTEISKEYGMYRQYYCGCVYSKKQRDTEIAQKNANQ